MADWGFVIGNSVVNRYVHSLYDMSAAVGSEKAVAEQLNIIKECILATKNYKKFLKKITLLTDEGKEFVNFLSSNLNLSNEVINLLNLLLLNKRFTILVDIVNAYVAYLDKLDGKKLFYITFAKDVSQDIIDKARMGLENVFSGKIECIIKKDESLINGVKLQYRSRILDYSLKSKLRRLHSAIKGENYEN